MVGEAREQWRYLVLRLHLVVALHGLGVGWGRGVVGAGAGTRSCGRRRPVARDRGAVVRVRGRGLRWPLGLGRLRDEDVGYAAAGFGVLGRCGFVFVEFGEFGDYVPGVD